MPIAYDATRLFLGPLSPTPRGIDRVDLAYMRHFFQESDEDCCALLPTAWGTRAFPRERVLRGLARLEELWVENRRPDDDESWQRLKLSLQGKATVAHRPRGNAFAVAARMTSLLKATGIGFGDDVVTALKPDTIYLNVGQIGLAFPILQRWLDRRRDVRPLFMLHDVIPLETPEYVAATSVKGHAAMVDQTARRAAGLIVTTKTAQAAIEAELARRAAPALPTLALPLPISAIFREPADADPALTQIPYFVVCGAIEPRKNHLLLLEVWKRLHRRLGTATPHLVIAGAMGWQGRHIADRLRRSGELGRHLHLVNGLSTPALKRLISGARALLMPSFIEGFGLPVVEAAAVGTPVVASDIPAHREVAHPETVFVDPIDGPGWEAAVLRLVGGNARPRLSAEFAPFTWDEYFAALSTFCGRIEARSDRA